MSSNRRGKRRYKDNCECCAPKKPYHGRKKETRSVLRAIAHGKRVNYAPFHSVWMIRSYGTNDGDEHVDQCGWDHVPGLSRWKKTLKRRNQ